ncbi:MAG: hypothetical protein Q9216_003724 [Gyalolechia sp. 2 TL-2023]
MLTLEPSVLLLGSVISLILYFSYQSLKKYQARKNLIAVNGCKSPPKYTFRDPFFGIDVLYGQIRGAKNKTYLNDRVTQYKEYGNTHSSRLITTPTILTIEPENIKAVFSTQIKNFEVGHARRRAFGPVIKISVLVADGVEWEHARAFLRPSFARSQVGDLATLETHVRNLIDAIPTNGSMVDLAELFLRYTADVTTDFMFGESILSLPHPDAFGGTLTEACRIGQLGVERRFLLGIFADIVPERAFDKAVRDVHVYMEAHVNKAIKNRDSGDEKKSTNIRKYVFADELARMTDDRLVLRDQLLGIFLAGRDTTAALLANLFFVLARNQRVWTLLHKEVASLGGKKPTWDQLRGLKYLTWCLNETLRLYPIVQGTSRVAVDDAILPKGGGIDGKSPVFVRAGTLVVFHFVALHKRKDLWGEDAEEFRPERWEKEKASWAHSTTPI